MKYRLSDSLDSSELTRFGVKPNPKIRRNPGLWCCSINIRDTFYDKLTAIPCSPKGMDKFFPSSTSKQIPPQPPSTQPVNRERDDNEQAPTGKKLPKGVILGPDGKP